jgi:hypothetical protein
MKTAPVLLGSFAQRPPGASRWQGNTIALGLLGVVACSDPQRRNSFEHFRD